MKTTKAIIVMNEQHSLMKDQKATLDSEYDSYVMYDVPAKGWSLDQMEDKYYDLLAMLGADIQVIGKDRDDPITRVGHQAGYDTDIVFVSPVQFLLKKLSMTSVGLDFHVKTFHNDRREKKELPNGKVIMTVAKEGWQLV